MEKLSRKLAELTAAKLEYDEEQADVIAYGLLAVFQTVSMLILSTIIGVIFGCFLECFTVFFAAGFLRKYTGGVHSKTLRGCLVMALVIIGLLGYISRFAFESLYWILADKKQLFLLLSAIIPIYSLCLLIIRRLAPVETENKPIRKLEKRKRLNRSSQITLVLFFIVSVLFLFLSYINLRFYTVSIALMFASLWQTFTLTKAGHRFIGIIDFSKPKP